MSTPPSYLIATAPKDGAPLLLWVAGYDCWVIGHWDGDAWFAEGGDRLNPAAWAPLPGRPG